MKAKLNMNEMYKKPPNDIIISVKESIDQINRYTPQEKIDLLKEHLSHYTNISPDSIFLSSGSDLLIKEFIFLFSHNRQIIIPNPTFIVINNAAQNIDSPLLKIKLKEPNFKIFLEALKNELTTPSLIVLDNPNNPTGNLIITQEDIETILDHENVILLIDEAYFEFSKVSYIDLVNKYPNLAVLRTLSKAFGLAGSGIGYLIAGEIIRKRFHGLDIMLPYPSVVAGIKALEHQEYMKDYVSEVQKEKISIIKYLSELNITCFPSYTNFLLVKTKIPVISQLLAKQGILVHDVSNQLSSEFFRITIGSNRENEYFMNTLEKIIG